MSVYYFILEYVIYQTVNWEKFATFTVNQSTTSTKACSLLGKEGTDLVKIQKETRKHEKEGTTFFILLTIPLNLLRLAWSGAKLRQAVEDCKFKREMNVTFLFILCLYL